MVERDPGHLEHPAHPEPPPERAAQILSVALRAGEVLLSSGGGVSSAVTATAALVRAFGLRGCATDATFTSLTVSYRPGPTAVPMTELRIVRSVRQDFSRIRAVDALVAAVQAGRLDLEAAATALDRIETAPDPYPGWLLTLGGGGLGGMFTVMLGGGPTTFAIAFAINVVIDLLVGWLGRRGIPMFYRAVLGGAFASAAGVGCHAAGWSSQAALIVAGGIAALLPGLAFTGGVQDAINGFLVTAAARTMDAAVVTVGLVAGVGLSLTAFVRAGVPIPALLATGPGLRAWSSLPVQVGAAMLVCALFALISQAPWVNLITAGVAGGAGWTVYLMLAGKAGFTPTVATALAAVLIGFGSQLFARLSGAPALLHLVVGIIPLAPGYAIYTGMFHLSQDRLGPGMAAVAQAVAIGLAIAAGSGFGQTIAGARGRSVRPRAAPSAGS